MQIFTEPIEIDRDGMTFDIYIMDSIGFEDYQSKDKERLFLYDINLQIF